MSEQKTIDIVFDSGPGPEPGTCCFVEVERDRQSIGNVGEWVHRDDGYWALRMPDPIALQEEIARLRLSAAEQATELAELRDWKERAIPRLLSVCAVDEINRLKLVAESAEAEAARLKELLAWAIPWVVEAIEPCTAPNAPASCPWQKDHENIRRARLLLAPAPPEESR